MWQAFMSAAASQENSGPAVDRSPSLTTGAKTFGPMKVGGDSTPLYVVAGLAVVLAVLVWKGR